MTVLQRQIMLVEDNPGDARLVREMLLETSETAPSFTHVETLRDAIQASKSGHFDLIVLDLNLPDSSGMDTVREIRAHVRNAPILVLTGNDEPELALSGIREGAQDCLSKKRIDAVSFEQAIRFAIERNQLLRRLQRKDRALEIINDCGRALARAADEEGMLRQVTEIIVERGGYPLAWIGHADQKAGLIQVAAAAGWAMDYLDSLRVTCDDGPHGRGPVGTAFRTGNTTIVRDIDTDPDFAPWRERARHYDFASILALPVSTDEGVIGVLAVYSKDALDFDSNEIDLMVSLARDVGWGATVCRARKARSTAELVLSATEERYRVLVESAHDGIYLLSADGIIQSLNPAFEELTGWKREEWVGRHFEPLIHPDDQGLAREVMARTLTGESVPPFELRIQTNEGGERVGEFLVAPYQISSTVVGLLGIARDVTARKHLEMERLRAHKMEALGRLAGGVAHDFNNILMVIRGHVDLLLEHGQSSEEVRDSLNQVVQASDRAANLTRQLLTYSRKQPLQAASLDLNRVLADLEKMLRRLIREDIHFQLQLAPELPPIIADITLLEQVIMNLVVNARDAMPHGGRLEITTRWVRPGEAACRAELSPDSHYVEMTITDTGVGIPTHVLNRVFEPFFTTKKEGEGTGLGLATTQSILTQLGGCIDLQSQEGAGAVFRLYFPADPSPCYAKPDPGSKLRDPSSGNETILLVEDEESLRHITKKVLERLGYRILDAPSGIDAFRLWGLHRDEIALLLTDVVLPGGTSGIQLARELRAARPDLKVILTTGYTDERLDSDVEYANLLRKPYPPQTLTSAVRECLDECASPDSQVA